MNRPTLSPSQDGSITKHARWAKDFPDFPMPPKEKPPYERDRRLPKSEH